MKILKNCVLCTYSYSSICCILDIQEMHENTCRVYHVWRYIKRKIFRKYNRIIQRFNTTHLSIVRCISAISWRTPRRKGGKKLLLKSCSPMQVRPKAGLRCADGCRWRKICQRVPTLNFRSTRLRSYVNSNQLAHILHTVPWAGCERPISKLNGSEERVDARYI